MAAQYFLIIIGLQFQWLEFHIKIQGLAGKQCAFSDHKAGKRSLFLKLGLEFQFQLSGHPIWSVFNLIYSGKNSLSYSPLAVSSWGCNRTILKSILPCLSVSKLCYQLRNHNSCPLSNVSHPCVLRSSACFFRFEPYPLIKSLLGYHHSVLPRDLAL